MSYSAAASMREISGLGDTPLVCPAGTFQVCPIVPPGQAMDWSKCSCRPNTAATTTASLTSAVNHHWGLILGLGAAAFVTYKVLTY